MYRVLPQLSDKVFLTDSGLETDLIFHGGFELPDFAAFVLVNSARGIEALEDYYRRHIDIAARAQLGVILETPTWRASSDWATKLGYSAVQLQDMNRCAVEMLVGLREEYDDTTIVISGCIGPRGDGYSPQQLMTEVEAEEYHRQQIATFADSEVDLVHAMTITYPAEAVGIVRAASAAGLPVVISFTTETDGRLPDGTSIADAIATVDVATGNAAAYFGINCSHPDHFAAALPDGAIGRRIRSIRANASAKSHAELDESPTLDEGDPTALAESYRKLRAAHPNLTIFGGCCGTDARHISAIAETV
jgi:S-methylmethionine-dependent homocysteine/selenocysteine methylase